MTYMIPTTAGMPALNMTHFNVGDAKESNCQRCCCEKLSLRPGTINKVIVEYAAWALPIGQLHCGPQFVLEQMETCLSPSQSNMPPQVQGGMARFDTAAVTALNGDLKAQTLDFENDPLTFAAVPFSGAKYGKFTLDPSGIFTYMPGIGFKGEERFYLSVTDKINPPVVFEMLIAVGGNSSLAAATPHVSIEHAGVMVDQRYYRVSFPVKVSPAAQLCEVWRLTVQQGALDCECQCYTRLDCFDIELVKC